jgi:hypothetical protein
MYKLCIAGAVAMMALASPAQAGNGRAVGAGIVGFGVGALVGSALAPREVYVVPPPPPPAYYYGPVGYGPPAWTPAWYSYCGRYPGFNPNTGYYAGPGGAAYFCR